MRLALVLVAVLGIWFAPFFCVPCTPGGAGDVRARQGRKRNPAGPEFFWGQEDGSRAEKVFVTLARGRGCLRTCGLLGALKGRTAHAATNEDARHSDLPPAWPSLMQGLLL